MATTYQCPHCLSDVEKRRCAKCREVKPLGEFYSRKYKGEHRPASWCKHCQKLDAISRQ
jgi:hypothetical protein